jgi:protein SDA1
MQKDRFDFSALHLVNNPQGQPYYFSTNQTAGRQLRATGMAEKLFSSLRRSRDRFEVRLVVMNLISRLVGVHELLLLNFYPFLQKYIRPQQRGRLLCFSLRHHYIFIKILYSAQK